MTINWKRLNRKIHFSDAIIIVIDTGLLLQFKKEIRLDTAETMVSLSDSPSLSLSRNLEIATTVTAADINNWTDYDRIDLRHSKGITKIRSNHSVTTKPVKSFVQKYTT